MTDESSPLADGEKIRVILADDHVLVRQGFRRILEESGVVTVLGEASSGAEAVRLALETRPHVAVLDLKMPGGISGIEATRQILAQAPEVRVLMLTMMGDEGYLAEALYAGAKGYLLKDASDAELVQAVRTLHSGSSYLSPALAAEVLQDYVSQSRSRRGRRGGDVLTDREREVLCLVAQGKTSKEISTLLNLSLNTVETHRARCMEKLGLHNTAELVLYAVRKGMVS
jgi:two-component system response regulator NreC